MFNTSAISTIQMQDHVLQLLQTRVRAPNRRPLVLYLGGILFGKLW